MVLPVKIRSHVRPKHKRKHQDVPTCEISISAVRACARACSRARAHARAIPRTRAYATVRAHELLLLLVHMQVLVLVIQKKENVLFFLVLILVSPQVAVPVRNRNVFAQFLFWMSLTRRRNRSLSKVSHLLSYL